MIQSRVLCILASASGEQSVSRQIAAELVAGLLMREPNLKVIVRDLTLDPPPHWGPDQIRAAFVAPHMRSPEARNALTLSDEYCAELANAQTLIIACPMWNLGVPSVLKAWLDHIVRVGVTFGYGPLGRVGLLRGLSRVYLIESMGGKIAAEQAATLNHVAPYLRQVFAFLDIADIRVISAQGTAIDREQAILTAREGVASTLL